MSCETLSEQIVACQRCPRLRAHCLQIAKEKRRAFLNWDYWGLPVPNFGDCNAELLIVGLAPAAHGANRTGRMFTGDQSGVWLYRALHKAGFASHPQSENKDDTLVLRNCLVTATCHCAPPDNKPTPIEIAHCAQWLQETFKLVPAKVFLALGQIAWQAVFEEWRKQGQWTGVKPKFAHGANVKLNDGRWVVGSFHPSQQNTFTGKLTEVMFDEIFHRCQQLISEVSS